MSDWEAIDDILPIGLLNCDYEEECQFQEFSEDSDHSSLEGVQQLLPDFIEFKRHYLSPVFEEFEYEVDLSASRSDSELSQISTR